MTTSGQNSSSSSRTPTVAADIMRPALTAVEPNDHLAAASYLMKHVGETALVVVGDVESEQPVGVITEADIVQAVADGKDLGGVRVLAIMTGDPTVISPATSIRAAATTMVSGRFRHLPVVDDDNRLLGIIDSLDVCGALLAFQPLTEGDAWTSR
ncbi:MAG TPA: CBS domain-containing protein [Streptosporangiaceae bacterium]|nr:CBS domain-containing protein [Streptosporangiaceae bacterium]